METLLEIYQQRLQDIKKMFLGLLSSIQDCKLFVSKPELTKYRIQYLGDIISKTLVSNQEKYIKKLENKLFQLQNKPKYASYEIYNQSPQRKISFEKNLSSQYSSQQYFDHNQENSEEFIRQQYKKYKPKSKKNNLCSTKTLSSFNSNTCSNWKKMDNSGHSQQFNKSSLYKKSSQENQQSSFKFKYLKLNI